MTESLDRWRTLVNDQLARVLDAAVDRAAGRVAEAMRYATMAGGKRLRPLLVLASCRACGGRQERAMAAALAVELIHTYSLVHDDLPAMDDDDLRRGKPTVHVAFDEATAVLVGDALQCLAFEILSDQTDSPANSVVRQIRTLSCAAGARGMVGGQALDLSSEGQPATRELVQRIHELKTGALLAACFRLGAQAAQVDDVLEQRMQHAGEQCGLAFQIQDDVLDVTSDSRALGKTAGKDLEQDKATWPAVVGLERAREEALELMNAALERIEPLGDAASPLRALIRASVERSA